MYDKPYTRMSVYLSGMMLGYILHTTNCKVKVHKVSYSRLQSQITQNKLLVFSKSAWSKYTNLVILKNWTQFTRSEYAKVDIHTISKVKIYKVSYQHKSQGQCSTTSTLSSACRNQVFLTNLCVGSISNFSTICLAHHGFRTIITRVLVIVYKATQGTIQKWSHFKVVFIYADNIIDRI